MRPSRPCSSTGAPSRFEPPSGCLFRCPKDGGATVARRTDLSESHRAVCHHWHE
jgi:hypothetical protein